MAGVAEEKKETEDYLKNKVESLLILILFLTSVFFDPSETKRFLIAPKKLDIHSLISININ